MRYDVADNWEGNNLELNQELLKKSKGLLDLLFSKIGITEKPSVSIIYLRKRGSYDPSNTKWNTEIFQRKLISQKDNQVIEYNDEKVIPLKDDFEKPKKLYKEETQKYINELKLISKNDNYYVFHYSYKDVIGGTKEDAYDYESGKLFPATYDIDDGLVTIFSVSKDIREKIEDDLFYNEIFKSITHNTFSHFTDIELVDNLLVNV